MRAAFTFDDIAADCRIDYGCHAVGDLGLRLGARVHVPPALFDTALYRSSAYAFMQQLRAAIAEHGLIEFPALPLNPQNHTLAQRAPAEHGYSSNPFLTGLCQRLHQDTPPYPTAFWLGAKRYASATWVVCASAADEFNRATAHLPDAELPRAHTHWVPRLVAEGRATLVNREPGLLLLDNSDAQRLFHCRTNVVDGLRPARPVTQDAPLHAFNEMGLLQRMQLDERRGEAHFCEEERRAIAEFVAREQAAEGPARGIS